MNDDFRLTVITLAALLAAAAGGLLPAVTQAQDPPAPPPASSPPAADNAARPDPSGQRDAEPAGTAPPARAPAAGKGSPQRFEPTEKVRPDFDVAFPVDI